jgi:gamma-glutamyl phosphate reductase
MIYESRPNVTIEAASWPSRAATPASCAAARRPSSPTWRCGRWCSQALAEAGLPPEAVQLVRDHRPRRRGPLITMPEYVDVIIPRGGKGLIERISNEAKVPVIKHLDGNCHTYVDAEFDLEKALVVTDNAKTQKYSPCNATESCSCTPPGAAFLPRIGAVFAAKGVEMRCDPAPRPSCRRARRQVVDATEADWSTEYLAPIISVKLVAALDEARSFDLIVFGATGFTGHLVAEYLQATYGAAGGCVGPSPGEMPPSSRGCAMPSGRAPPLPLLTADASDVDALAALAARTRGGRRPRRDPDHRRPVPTPWRNAGARLRAGWH